MKLHEGTTQYVAYKQSMGMRFRTEARIFKSLCRMAGDVWYRSTGFGCCPRFPGR